MGLWKMNFECDVNSLTNFHIQYLEVFEIVCRMMDGVNPGSMIFFGWGGWDCGRCILNIMFILWRIYLSNIHDVLSYEFCQLGGRWDCGRCILNVLLIVWRVSISSTHDVFELVSRRRGRLNPGFINFTSWDGSVEDVSRVNWLQGM